MSVHFNFQVVLVTSEKTIQLEREHKEDKHTFQVKELSFQMTCIHIKKIQCGSRYRFVELFNRPGVAGPVLQTPSSFID